MWLGAQSIDPGRLTTGQDVTYTIRYGNLGSHVAHTTTLTLSLSFGLDLISVRQRQLER